MEAENAQVESQKAGTAEIKITLQSVDTQQAHKLLWSPLLFVMSARNACLHGEEGRKWVCPHVYDREELDGNASSKEHAESDRCR